MQAEVCGKVVSVSAKNNKNFHIFAPNSGKKYTCIYDGFFPIKIGDAIQGVCEYSNAGKEEVLTFKVPPYTVIGCDKESILAAIGTALRGTGYSVKKGEKIYEILLREAGSAENVANLLCNFALHYNYEPINYDPFTLFSTTIELKQFIKLCKYCYKNFVLRNLYLLGLNNREIHASKYDPIKLYERIIENPYTITSVPLDKCDDILSRCGKSVDMQFRDCGKIVRKIADMMENGHTCVSSSMLLRMFPNLVKFVPILKSEFGIETDLHSVYLPYAYEVETFMANKIRDMANSEPKFQISNFSYTRDDLSPEQLAGIEKSLKSNISVITGSGGSGKTACIKELVHNLEINGIPYRIASFTGKAVARIREVTGKKEPATLHMMISQAKSKPKTKETFKCLILDEASMITSELLYEFLQTFRFPFSIIFVGDVNQLPPISWGNLLESLIECKIVPVTVLKTVHRTEGYADNGILINANRIVRFKNIDEGEEEFEFEITKNFKIVPGDLDTVKNMLTVLKNNGIPSEKIVVVSPYNKDLEVINSTSSTLYNGNNRSITDSQKKMWRIGDRVMSSQNNYSVNLTNGSEGVITDVDAGQEQITVKFEEGTYNFKTGAVCEDDDGTKELNTANLILSFALSVHKMQGSEVDYVIGYIPAGKPSSTFINSNLLYTLITRTKKVIWLIGDIETIVRSATTKPSWRCSNLTKRIL
jgi:exodeoxyribonuclease V alpha subunit